MVLPQTDQTNVGVWYESVGSRLSTLNSPSLLVEQYLFEGSYDEVTLVKQKIYA